jgi:hypothetical protein
MKDVLPILGKALLIGTLLLPLGIVFLLTKLSIWVTNKVLAICA